MTGETVSSETGRFALGDFPVLQGGRIAGATLGWKRHGRLNAARDNLVLYPTSYGAQHPELEWLIGAEGILDPARFCILQVDMFGNGLSSSPSNTPDYPALVTAWDNVHAQRRLIGEVFGVERLHAVYGWSMGAQQAYHWAACFPKAVGAVVVNCGSARTAIHNQVFLRSLLAVLEAAPEHIGQGRFSAPPVAALRAFGRIYAGWALSQDFYRAGLHLSTSGAPDLESFLTGWEERYLARDAANLYAQLRCWNAGDISANPLYGGDLEKALRAIEARVLLMPGATDLYFRTADNEAELPFLRHAQLSPIPSIWGHRAGNPIGNPQDIAFIRAAVRNWLG
ncbi:alpha/beta fold hydrolase [Roseomonas sp. USHLN139]|uniref:alpha/beta fold hydrolase n=1 Tax=Roseomonas sp. USHLN139 TaxID=3081298 RepID=UPI003B01D668